MEKDIFKERGRGMEEAYFRQQDAKLIERLHQEAKLEEIAIALAEKLQVDNPELLRRVMELGVKVDAAPAFFLAPLVQVAWVVSRSARRLTPSSSSGSGSVQWTRSSTRQWRSSSTASRSCRRRNRRSASSGWCRRAMRWQRRQGVDSPRCSVWGAVSLAARRRSSIPSPTHSGATTDSSRTHEMSVS